MIKKLTLIAAAVAGLLALALPAHATEGDPHQVVVCKYVGTPGEDEVLQTGQNPIVVDVAALEKDGFVGVFPFAFEDAQGNSVAIRYAANAQDGSITECPGYVPPTTPPPTTPPPTTPPPTEPPTTPPPVTTTVPPTVPVRPTEEPNCHDTKTCTTWVPTWSPTGGATPGEHPLAMTGSDVTSRALAGLGLLALGLGSLYWMRKAGRQ